MGPEILFAPDRGGGVESKERERFIDTARVLLLRLPSEEEVEKDLAQGRVPELRVELGVKSDKSRHKGRWTLFGGKRGKKEGIARTAARELGEEANVYQIIGDDEYDYQFSYELPNDGGKRNLRVFVWFAPNFDKAYPVEDKEAKIGRIERVALSQFLEMVESGDERLLEYLREMGQWEGSALEHLREIGRLFQWKIREVVLREGSDARRVSRELVFWEAREYLRRYVQDEYRFAFAFFSVMFAEGVSLWSRREELLSLLEDKKAQERLSGFLGLLEKVGKVDGANWNWRKLKQKLVELDLWTGEISGLDLRKEVDGLMDNIVMVLQKYGSELGHFGDVSVMNEARSYSLKEMVKRMIRGRGRESFEIARWFGLFYGMMRVRGDYEAKLDLGELRLREFLEKVLIKTEEVVDWGEVGGEAGVRLYQMSDGREVRVVWVDKGEKSFQSFFRKVLLVGKKKMEEINDVFRTSLVVLEPDLAEEFYEDFVSRLGDKGFKCGSKRREEGKKIRNQLGVMKGEEDRMEPERESSIADRFAEAKFYVWREDGDGEIWEAAVWGAPYNNPLAKGGFIQPDLEWYGFLEKLIDDEFYPFWRLVTLLAIFFPDTLYGEVIGKLVSLRKGREYRD